MTEAAARLADLAERYWRFECEEAPFTAILAGEPTRARMLFREAATDYARRDAAAAAMLEELAAIPTEALSVRDLATHRLMRRELDAIRAHYAVDSQLRPWLLPVGPEFNTIFYANSVALTDTAGADLYVARIESIGAFLEQVRQNMLAGTAKGIRYSKIVLEAAVPNVRAHLDAKPEDTPWYGPFKRSVAAANPGVQAAAARAASVIRDAIFPALAAYADALAGPVMAAARDTIACRDDPGGADYYRAWVRYFTTTEDTPEQIHVIGLAEVARLEAEMEPVAAHAGFAGDLAGYRRFLANDPQFFSPDADALRVTIEALAKRIDRLIPAWFARIPRITYGVDTIPPAPSLRLPPAYAQPGPADGSAAGIFWVTGLPERCPSHMHVALTLHEAWPGHLMHIALMQETDGLPAFRRHGSVKYTVFVEGWALYCEGLGVEMGLYQTPHQQFGRLEMELWRAIRLVLDTGIHWHGWSRAQAIDYMAARLSLARETIEQEVDRYIAFPGQALAYQIGNLRLWAARARAEAALGERFTARAFHSAVMTAGPVSLPLLDEVVDAWIAEQATV